MNGKEIWEQVAKGELSHAMDEAAQRPITPEEIYYLLSKYAYIKVHHPDGFKPTAGRTPTITHVKGGWDLYDYGDLVAVCPGEYLHGAREGKENDMTGTAVNQMKETANALVGVCVDKGWPSAVVLNGFYGMVRAFWIGAESKNFPILGFTPTQDDRVINAWVNTVTPEALTAPNVLTVGGSSVGTPDSQDDE